MRDAARQDFGREFNKNPESNSQAWAVMDLGELGSRFTGGGCQNSGSVFASVCVSQQPK